VGFLGHGYDILVNVLVLLQIWVQHLVLLAVCLTANIFFFTALASLHHFFNLFLLKLPRNFLCLFRRSHLLSDNFLLFYAHLQLLFLDRVAKKERVSLGLIQLLKCLLGIFVRCSLIVQGTDSKVN